ncbi:MAG: hypothetical protein SFX18_13150 [Pirellulales bacterium]|nr:hypothetical protein [Pirellulales bacterium]
MLTHWRGAGLTLFTKICAGCCVLGLLWGGRPMPSTAETLGNSLDFVPADVSFYSSSLRLREQWELLTDSKAWVALTNMASVQLGLQQLRGQFNSEDGALAPVQAFLEDPENADLLELCHDAFKHEIFIYGDAQFAPTLNLINNAYGSIYYSSMMSGLKQGINDDGEGPPRPEEMAAAFLQTLNADLPNVAIPNMVIGLKITKPEIAEKELRRLEMVLTRLLAPIPPALERFKREKVGTGTFLTLNVEGALVPWEEIPWQDVENEPGEYDKLRNQLQQMNLNVSIGVNNGYILVGIGSGNQHLGNLAAEKLLRDREEFAALKPHLDQRLTSIAWTNQQMMELSSGLTTANIDGLVQLVEQVLVETDLPENVQSDLKSDAASLAEDIKKQMPAIGPSLGFSFMTNRGYEGYWYNWTEDRRLDASQPLGILSNLSGNPLLAIASRGQYRPEDYDILAKWAKKGFGYFQEHALPQMSEEERAQAELVISKAMPLVERLDRVNRELLIRSVKDGQSAIVLDAQIASKTWIGEQPPANEPLPMLELAVILSVTDMPKFKQAFVELREIGQGVVDMIRELNPGEIPADYAVPTPKTRKLDNGAESYWYDLPAEIQLDKQILPHGATTENLALISSSPRLTTQVLKPTPLKNEFLSAVASKPISMAFIINTGDLLQKIAPWVEYGFAQAAAERGGNITDYPEMIFAQNEVRTALSVLACVQSISGYSYREGAATVTHTQTLIRDLE